MQAASPINQRKSAGAKLRWCQFTLRAFFVLITGTGISFGLWAHRAAQQQAAVQRVVSLGGEITYEDGFEGRLGLVAHLKSMLPQDYVDCVIEVDLSNQYDFEDSDLHCLQPFTELQVLWLTHTKVSDAGLQQLRRFTELRYLRVYGTQVSEQGARRLRCALPNCEVDR